MLILQKSFSKVFRENVNVLSSSSGKDNFYVFLLFLAVTNWQIIVITFSISFLEDLTFSEIHIFSFLTFCCATHRVKKEALIPISLRNVKERERKRERTRLILSISSEDAKFSFMSSASKLTSLSKLV